MILDGAWRNLQRDGNLAVGEPALREPYDPALRQREHRPRVPHDPDALAVAAHADELEAEIDDLVDVRTDPREVVFPVELDVARVRHQRGQHFPEGGRDHPIATQVNDERALS